MCFRVFSDERVGSTARFDRTDVDRFGEKICKIASKPRRKILVQEKLQRTAILSGMLAKIRKPPGSFFLQIGEVSQDFVLGQARSEIGHQIVYGEAQAANAGLASTLPGSTVTRGLIPTISPLHHSARASDG